jgi:hypothetical protein
MSGTTWTVYGSQPPPAPVHGEREARRLARTYTGLGMRADLYEYDSEGNHLRRIRIDEDGNETVVEAAP